VPEEASPARALPARLTWKPGTLLAPVPVVLVTSGGGDEPANVATVAWAGTVCSDPPLLSISLRAATLTHGIVQRTGEFVVNVPCARIVRAVDLCGVISGRAGDKFATAGLTPVPATQVKAPIVAECPIALECRVRQVLELGLHTMFVAEILAVSVARELVERDGRLAIERADLVAFAHGSYFALGPVLGAFGYSVRKKAPTPRKPGRRPRK
jgi:flavin reductase (DIM6/NTAB) family NADH-FMN oxidoreductase RutF